MMMPRLGQIVFSLITATLLTGCDSLQQQRFREVYVDDFEIGTALGSEDMGHDYIYPMRKDPKELEIIAREFDCVTPENLMKWQYVHPRPGFYNFDQSDEFMDFADAHGLDVVGHVLVWHSQVPDWVFQGEEGNPVSRDVLIERMRDHIHTVVGRYKGRIRYWDVVNEAVDTRMEEDDSLPPDEDGNPQKKCIAFYRKSPWLEIIGPDYIELAFRFAREADPDASLLYNDYSMTDLEKTRFVADMVRNLKVQSVPVDGVGMQGHWHLEYPARDELQDAIDILASAGVSVSITELDIGVLPRFENDAGADINNLGTYRSELNPYTNGVPQQVEQKQIEKYRMIMEVLLENREHVDRVTFWGVSDLYSWKNDFPIRGRTDYPLLFDRQMQPKAAVDMLKKLRRADRSSTPLAE